MALDAQSSGFYTSTFQMKSQLIDLLEFEIKTIQEEGKRPGWTVWALAASIASAFWLVLSELQIHSKEIAFSHVALLALSCWFGWQTLSLVSAVAFPWSRLRRFGSRFWYSNVMLVDDRLNMLAGSICDLLLMLAIVALPLIYQNIISWFVLTVLAMDLFSNLTAIILSYFTIPISPIVGAVAAFPVGAVFYLILNGACVAGIVSDIVPQWSAITWLEIKVALAATTGTLLILQFLQVRQANPLMNTLVDLRRRLGLGQVDEEFAKREIEIAFNGMNASDVLRAKIDAILTKRRQVVVIQNEILNEYNALVKVIGGAAGMPLSKEQKTLLETVVRSTEPKFTKSVKLADESLHDIGRLNKKVERLMMWFPLARENVKQAFKAIKEQTEQLTTETKKVDAEIRERTDHMRKWLASEIKAELEAQKKDDPKQ